MSEFRILGFEVHGWAGVERIELHNVSWPLAAFWSTENKQGKTSLGEALRGAMGGKSQIGKGVIRDGHDEASCSIDFGEFTIHCTIDQERGHSVKVRRDGKAVKGGKQTYLDGLIGTMHNPVELLKLDSDKLLDELRSLAGAEWVKEHERLQGEYKRLYDLRTDAGRRLRNLGARPEAVPDPTAARVAVAELNQRIDEETAAVRASERAAADWDRAEAVRVTEWKQEQSVRRSLLRANATDKETADTDVIDLTADLTVLQAKLAAAKARVVDAVTEAADLPAPDDEPPEHGVKRPEPYVGPILSDLRGQRDTADEHNRLADEQATAYRRYQDNLSMHVDADAEHEDLDLQVKAAEKAGQMHGATAKLPEDLTIKGKKILFLDRPLARASEGEGWLLCFQMAAHRGQKVVIIDSAESLGPATIKEIDRLTREFNMHTVGLFRGKPQIDGACELRHGQVWTTKEDGDA